MGHVDIWVWAISVAVIVGFFFFDFYSHVKHAHVPSLREAGLEAEVAPVESNLEDVFVAATRGRTDEGEGAAA